MEDVRKIAKVVDAGKPRPPSPMNRARRSISVAVLSAVAAAGFAGCSSNNKKEEQTTHLGANITHGDQPQVISGTPLPGLSTLTRRPLSCASEVSAPLLGSTLRPASLR